MTGPITDGTPVTCNRGGSYKVTADIASNGSEVITLEHRPVGYTHWQPYKKDGTPVTLIAGDAAAEIKIAAGEEFRATRNFGSAVAIRALPLF